MYVKYVQREPERDILYLDDQITHAPLHATIFIEDIIYVVVHIAYIYSIIESQNSNSLKMFSNKLSVIVYIDPVSK